MELSTVIQSRRSIRKFKPDPISNEDLYAIIEAARLAPSALNIQPWRYVIAKSQSIRESIAQSTSSAFIANAPVQIICCVDSTAFDTVGKRYQELHQVNAFTDSPFETVSPEDILKGKPLDPLWIQSHLAFNVAIAITHITLKATDLGLGSCWVGEFDQEKIKLTLELDDRYRVIALIPIGYPDQTPAPRPRLPLAELILGEV